jgi:hypothetical protein
MTTIAPTHCLGEPFAEHDVDGRHSEHRDNR